MPSGPSDRAIQAMIDRNNHNLLRLQAGMFEEYVNDVMGPPQRLEGYSWGMVWLYRTAWTKEARTTPKTDFTPLVFDRSGVLVGWGRDFFVAYSTAQPSAGGVLRPWWLAADTYSLVAVDNEADGPNGLSSITSALPLTMTGAGIVKWFWNDSMNARGIIK
jgi:hypothetical protein